MWNQIQKIVMASLVVVLAQFAGTGPASAGTLTVWPDKFRIAYERNPEIPTLQNPDTLTGLGGYYYVLDLPAGATIKYITVNYHKPEGSNFNWCAYLRRKQPNLPYENLIDFSPTISEVPEGDGSMQSTSEHVKGSLKLERGYRYYIQYEPKETGSLYSLQVEY